MTAIVLGAGGHAAVVVEILLANRIDLVGLIDPSYDPVRARDLFGVPLVGADDLLPQLKAKGVDSAFIAVGDNALRRRLGTLAQSQGLRLLNAIHPMAIVSPSAEIGSGVAIMATGVVNARTRIGDGVIVNTGASVDHDCRIGAWSHLAPGSRLGGSVSCGERVFVGIGASVIPGISLGDGVTIGAGAAVVSDVAAGATVVGVPARPRP